MIFARVRCRLCIWVFSFASALRELAEQVSDLRARRGPDHRGRPAAGQPSQPADTRLPRRPQRGDSDHPGREGEGMRGDRYLTNELWGMGV